MYPTKILNSENIVINSVIDITPRLIDTIQYFYVGIRVENEQNYIGEMKCYVDSTKCCLRIVWIENLNSAYRSNSPSTIYRHVASLLIDVAFKLSLDNGMDGHLLLETMNISGLCYFKNGFRRCSTLYILLRDEIIRYKINPTQELKQKITDSTHFVSLKKNAALYMTRELKENKQASEISFEEAIEYGRYSEVNMELEEFEKLIKSKKTIGIADCSRHFLDGLMYLSHKSIEERKRYLNSLISQNEKVTDSYQITVSTLMNNRSIAAVKKDEIASLEITDQDYIPQRKISNSGCSTFPQQKIPLYREEEIKNNPSTFSLNKNNND